MGTEFNILAYIWAEKPYKGECGIPEILGKMSEKRQKNPIKNLTKPNIF